MLVRAPGFLCCFLGVPLTVDGLVDGLDRVRPLWRHTQLMPRHVLLSSSPQVLERVQGDAGLGRHNGSGYVDARRFQGGGSGCGFTGFTSRVRVHTTGGSELDFRWRCVRTGTPNFPKILDAVRAIDERREAKIAALKASATQLE